MKRSLSALLLMPYLMYAQHDHAPSNNGSHLNHIIASRKQTVYIHNLPPPVLMDGIGSSKLIIQTSSEKTQQYFNQGVALLHCFWDLEAYRAFKEAIRHDSSAIMPYWGLMETIGSFGNEEYNKDKELALRKLRALKAKASEHERLYAEAVLLSDSVSDREYTKKLERIIHKYPDDLDAKLLLALKKMSGFDADMNPHEGQMYSEYLLRDILRQHPDNAGAHHYWIHQMENCCPEQALESAEKLAALAPRSGHIVHMPGHVYYKLGNYEKAYDAFITSARVDSAYMEENGIEEVDNWNFIHNINYLLANCAEDGRYSTGLRFAHRLKKMVITKERKKAYDKAFFYQGILAPARMEMRFARWKNAVSELKAIENKDSLYGGNGMAYKEALMYFCLGMAALEDNNIRLAIASSNELDAFLWRNAKQHDEASNIGWRASELNVASLELQGLIKSAQGNYIEALGLLGKAEKKEKELGYGEPPTYVRPVLLSIAAVHEKAGNFDKAIDAYESLLRKRPNSANALLGLATAYRKKGDLQLADESEEKFMAVTRHGDPDVFRSTQTQRR